MLDGDKAKEIRKKGGYHRRPIKVLDSTAAVFADKGYHGTSAGEIVSKLGIAQSSLYYYIKSKDEAVEMVCLQGTKGLFKRLTVIVEC